MSSAMSSHVVQVSWDKNKIYTRLASSARDRLLSIPSVIVYNTFEVCLLYD